MHDATKNHPLMLLAHKLDELCVVDHLQLLFKAPMDTAVVLGIPVIVDDDRVRLTVGVADPECCAIQVAKGTRRARKRRSCEPTSVECSKVQSTAG